MDSRQMAEWGLATTLATTPADRHPAPFCAFLKRITNLHAGSSSRGDANAFEVSASERLHSVDSDGRDHSRVRSPTGSIAAVVPEELKLRGKLAGFLVGLFHGVTIVFNMIAALLLTSRIYAFPNFGHLYDLGLSSTLPLHLAVLDRAARSVDGETVVMDLDLSATSVLHPPSFETAISTTCPSCGHHWL